MLRKFIATLLICSASSVHAGDTNTVFDPKTMSSDDLLVVAVRYGNTQERRDQKEAARNELFERREDGFKAVMAKSHLENVGVQVLAQEFVERLPASNAVPVLLDVLSSTPTNTHKLAVYFLGFYKTPEHADRIKPLLADERLRGVSIRTLGKWGVSNAVSDIQGYLTSTNERIRVACANALRDIGEPSALPALIKSLGDPVFTVRNTAQRAIVTFGAAAEKPLIEALAHAKSPALRLIIQSLGEMKSRRAAKALKRLQESGDPLVRDEIDRALEAIRSSPHSWF